MVFGRVSWCGWLECEDLRSGTTRGRAGWRANGLRQGWRMTASCVLAALGSWSLSNVCEERSVVGAEPWDFFSELLAHAALHRSLSTPSMLIAKFQVPLHSARLLSHTIAILLHVQHDRDRWREGSHAQAITCDSLHWSAQEFDEIYLYLSTIRLVRHR